MSTGSAIEWTDATWNPLVGCSRVSAGCERCYAERLVHRGLSKQHRGLTRATSRGPVWTGEVRLLAERLAEPQRWKKPRRVFVNSLSDLFADGVPRSFIAATVGIMAATPQHTYQILTKRAERMREVLASIDVEEVREATLRVASRMIGGEWKLPLPNVWWGVSCENQEAAEERVPLLLQTPAAVRFVSAEPLLGPLDFSGWLWGRAHPCDGCPRDADCECGTFTRADLEEPSLDWIIVGGESGPGARPCDVGWIRSIVEQTREAGVACFVKQIGAKPIGLRVEECDACSIGVDVAPRKHAIGCDGKPLSNRKGGDPSEWPEDLRVRQMPDAGR